MAFNRVSVETLVFPPVSQTIRTEDCLLYALSLGLGRDPTDPHDLAYIYEAGLRALPTMAAVLCTPGHWVADPALGINADSVLHGEQAIRFHRPIPVGQTLTGHSRVTDVWDKGPGKGALIEIECRVTDHADAPIWTVNRTAYLRGEGGYGGPVQQKGVPWILPDRSPDAVYDMPTGGHQALLYRLNGDMNPVHADPEVAAGVGFARPILHGLCTYGIAGYALLHSVCDHDETRMGTLSLRFSAPAYPGDTIRTEIWREGNRALFRCLAVERGVQVTTNGVMDFAMGDIA